MSNLFAPEGKTFLVAGGATGLGAQFVETFLKADAKGVAILDVQVDSGTKLAEGLNKSYPNKVIFVKCDVSDEKEANKAFNEVLEKFKQLDVIINHAGIMVDSPTAWRKASDVNVVGVNCFCDLFQQGVVDFTMKGIKHMRKDSGGAGGTIINISSIVGLCRLRFLPIYSGSKAAVLHFSQSISGGDFHDKTGIRILTVCLGPTESELMDNLEQRVWDGSDAQEFPEVSLEPQKMENAVAAVHKIFKEGLNGSIWVSLKNKPVQNITPAVDAGFTEFERLILS